MVEGRLNQISEFKFEENHFSLYRELTCRVLEGDAILGYYCKPYLSETGDKSRASSGCHGRGKSSHVAIVAIVACDKTTELEAERGIPNQIKSHGKGSGNVGRWLWDPRENLLLQIVSTWK